MGSNGFGKYFQMTTWGESHGKAIGCIIDGCPAGLELNEKMIQAELDLRAPGRSLYTSPRKETDHVQILSGVFEGRTTGAPISLQIQNIDADSSKYDGVKSILKPGHAQYAFLEKYGLFDHRGGGRASARETACRVAAGAIAKRFLLQYGIEVVAHLSQVGAIAASEISNQTREHISENPLFCADGEAAKKMALLLQEAIEEGDSVGGVVSFIATGVPAGLGEPVYDKLTARLAYAMMSIPAAKGFEMGEGFQAALMQGSKHNDSFQCLQDGIKTKTNHAGGTLGGISNGMPIYGRVAFKPASSILKEQDSITREGERAKYTLPQGSRHDPCVAVRAVPVVGAMASLVLADLLLMQRMSKV